MNENPPKKQPASATSEPQEIELEDQIRVRAYELYELRAYELYEQRGRENGEQRGRENGHAQEDWFRAKEELTVKKFRTATA